MSCPQVALTPNGYLTWCRGELGETSSVRTRLMDWLLTPLARDGTVITGSGLAAPRVRTTSREVTASQIRPAARDARAVALAVFALTHRTAANWDPVCMEQEQKRE